MYIYIHTYIYIHIYVMIYTHICNCIYTQMTYLLMCLQQSFWMMIPSDVRMLNIGYPPTGYAVCSRFWKDIQHRYYIEP